MVYIQLIRMPRVDVLVLKEKKSPVSSVYTSHSTHSRDESDNRKLRNRIAHNANQKKQTLKTRHKKLPKLWFSCLRRHPSRSMLITRQPGTGCFTAVSNIIQKYGCILTTVAITFVYILDRSETD